jgi:hypothetical protein
MFDYRHYVPILKGKKGELLALAKAENLQQFTALVEVVPIPLTHPEDRAPAYQSKTIDQHIKDTADAFKQAMGILPRVFIDGLYIESENKLRDGKSAVEGLFSRLRDGGIRFVPTIGLDRAENYIIAVRDAIALDKQGCCLRLVESDLESLSDLDSQIQTLLKALNVTIDHVHLLVDLKNNLPLKVTLPLLINELPRLNDWQTLTLSSSSFPQFLSDVRINSADDHHERLEWIAWLYVREKQNAARKRVPTFSDYGINHPTLTDDTDPRMLTIAPNIRYTGSTSYVVAKGQAPPKKKKQETAEQEVARMRLALSVQYPKLAALIKVHPSWKDGTFSWGDKFIDRCSQKKCTGNRSDWRGVGASHHIALVVQQLANLP